jgi:hypothetical protein
LNQEHPFKQNNISKQIITWNTGGLVRNIFVCQMNHPICPS